MFTLSSHISNTYPTDAPKLDKDIFRNRLRGDQVKIMSKSIKIFENYLKKVGKNQIFWDEVFMAFLMLNDHQVIRKLSGIEGKDLITEG